MPLFPSVDVRELGIGLRDGSSRINHRCLKVLTLHLLIYLTQWFEAPGHYVGPSFLQPCVPTHTLTLMSHTHPLVVLWRTMFRHNLNS